MAQTRLSRLIYFFPTVAIKLLQAGRDAGKDMGRVLRDEVWPFLADPVYAHSVLKSWDCWRADRRFEARLNRQAREAFVESLRQSKRDHLSVETYHQIEKYLSTQNEYDSFLSRLYRHNKRQILPVRAGSIVGLALAARAFLLPVIGLWGLAVTSTVLIATALAEQYHKSKLKRLEQSLSSKGILVPPDFHVQNGSLSVAETILPEELHIGFPILESKPPQWLVGIYSQTDQAFQTPEVVHAAAFEAYKRGYLAKTDIPLAKARFKDHPDQEICFYMTSILFPDMPFEDRVEKIQTLASEETEMLLADKPDRLTKLFYLSGQKAQGTVKGAFTAALVQTLNAFCFNGKNAGLSGLSGKVTLDDLKYLCFLRAQEVSIDVAQAHEIVEFVNDPRFFEYGSTLPERHVLSFRDIVELTSLPDQEKKSIIEFWKDGNYRKRFTYNEIKDMTSAINEWGERALSIASFDYSEKLTFSQIKELSLRENEKWARNYHDLCTAHPDITSNMTYDGIKTCVCQDDFTISAPHMSACFNGAGGKPSQSHPNHISEPDHQFQPASLDLKACSG